MRRTLAPLLLLASLLMLALLLPLGPTQAQQGDGGRIYLPLVARPLPAIVSSYLGSAGDDSVVATDFDGDGQLILAGRFAPGPIGGVAARDLPGGTGAVVRLNADGTAVVAAARVGGALRDVDVSATGAVLACGASGVTVLDGQLSRLLWQANPGEVERCAMASNGAVAALVGTTIFRYAPDGVATGTIAVAGTAVADVALDAASGLVFATGYTQKLSDLKVAFIRAYAPDGALRWTAYDQGADAIVGAGLTADSEGRRLSMGADGMLYFGGWTDGGNSIFQRDPRDATRTLSSSELISFDPFNTPFGIRGARSLAWYGRFDPANGALMRGQWLLTRLSDGGGNSIAIGAIEAAADGTVVIGGGTAASIANRATASLGGVTLGGYEIDEAFLLVVSPDFTTRRLWTVFTAPGTTAGGSPTRGVAISGGRVAVGITLNPRTGAPPRGLLTTPNGPQPNLASPTATEGYYALLRAP